MKTIGKFLFLILIITSCSPSPEMVAIQTASAGTSTPEATATQAPTATIDPTPTPTPWKLETAISRIPEVYTSSISQETVEIYTQLVSEIPLEAQYWITSTGWGLQDFILGNNEIELLNLLSMKDNLDALMILTSPRMIDGVSKNDIDWARNDEVKGLSNALEADILELFEIELITEQSIEKISGLIQRAETNYEALKGLCLIANYGHPNNKIFSRNVPNFNTQLFVLIRLLDMDISADYELAAIAAGLDYGSMITITEENLYETVIDYAYDMILFLAETDKLLAENEASWVIRDDTLEQLISLVWGAPGNYFPITTEISSELNIEIKPNNSWKGFYFLFRKKPFTKEFWDWSFVEIDNLREMRSLLIDKEFILLDRQVLADEIFHFYYETYLDYEWNPYVEEIDGWEISNSYISNMNYQWELFKNKKKFKGTSGDAYIDMYLKKSIGIAGFTPTFWIHQTGYFDDTCRCWKASQIEFTHGTERSKDHIDDHLGWNKVPWDNFILDNYQYNIHGYGRTYFMLPMPNYVWLNGVPAGYIYRIRD